MNYVDVPTMDMAKDKVIECLETGTQMKFSELWHNLGSKQYIYVIFFRRFGCIFCKASAMEISKTGKNIEKRYPGLIKVVGIGVDTFNYEEWKRGDYFAFPMFVNRNMTIYKSMKMKSPGLLNCYGACYKKLLNNWWAILKNPRMKSVTTQLAGGNFFQLGGSFLLDKQGAILFHYFDSFYGDHPSEEQLMDLAASLAEN